MCHSIGAGFLQSISHTLDQTGCLLSNSWLALRDHHWFSVQNTNQWRRVHLILSSAFQKPSNTELVSLHFKSDRRCPKLCCEHPACCFALIESMQHEPRQREVVTPCICCLACTETAQKKTMFWGSVGILPLVFIALTARYLARLCNSSDRLARADVGM